jgi:hypothetical protein
MGFCYTLDMCLVICQELLFNCKANFSLIRFNLN